MHLMLLPFLLLVVLFKREVRIAVLLFLLVVGAATWWVGSFWSERYDHWVDCGRPQVGICQDYSRR